MQRRLKHFSPGRWRMLTSGLWVELPSATTHIFHTDTRTLPFDLYHFEISGAGIGSVGRTLICLICIQEKCTLMSLNIL